MKREIVNHKVMVVEKSIKVRILKNGVDDYRNGNQAQNNAVHKDA